MINGLLTETEILKHEFREAKKEYVMNGDFDGHEALGIKVMFPIPMKIRIMMDRLFNGYETKDGITRIMTVEDINFD